jgi:hypothetical protein
MITKTADVSEQLQGAADFANDPRLLAAFAAATRDDKSWSRAMRDPKPFLREQNVRLPSGLDVHFIDPKSAAKPVPDWEWFFTIEFTQCRRFWVKKEDGIGWERVEVCFGFAIVPKPIPGGPIG